MSNFDLNILVNGNRCKQYQHENRTYIESKKGSEYVIEIKNNHNKRILAVSSVDGLDVLSGKTATEENTGYIIDSYHSEKIKGFRYSDDAWALFKFGYKFDGKTYAQSKNDGSKKNCGVIGVRLFYEKEQPLPTYLQPNITIYPSVPYNPWYPWYQYPTWYSTSGTTGAAGISSSTIGNAYSGTNSWTANSNVSSNYTCNASNLSHNISNCSVNFSDGILRSANKSLSSPQITKAEAKAEFDMGTEWGRKEDSKVCSVLFEKGNLAESFDIYYASREALIAMGVPLTKDIKVSFPQSFQKGYAKPPKGWNG